MPNEGMNREEYRTAKFGSWERSPGLDAQVQAVGAAEGITFAFDGIGRTPNTLDAHRLIWLAEKEGVQDAVVEIGCIPNQRPAWISAMATVNEKAPAHHRGSHRFKRSCGSPAYAATCPRSHRRHSARALTPRPSRARQDGLGDNGWGRDYWPVFSASRRLRMNCRASSVACSETGRRSTLSASISRSLFTSRLTSRSRPAST